MSRLVEYSLLTALLLGAGFLLVSIIGIAYSTPAH